MTGPYAVGRVRITRLDGRRLTYEAIDHAAELLMEQMRLEQARRRNGNPRDRFDRTPIRVEVHVGRPVAEVEAPVWVDDCPCCEAGKGDLCDVCAQVCYDQQPCRRNR